jgi:hypothetical protein
MHRLKIQSVRSVPPIPTTIIEIPNVQLSISILIYLHNVWKGLHLNLETFPF